MSLIARGSVLLVLLSVPAAAESLNVHYAFTKPNDIELDGRWFGRDPEPFKRCQQ